ncbi:hypothetical protein [Pseudomonas syringae]|uniref:hypothetical protein n=1 Tax=Pseudomonas syringae TaxID=317 RepID=UPI001F3F88C5|nr:hypothetical protein [Pseudomonas syringae]MCF5371307.1 hypothetical protein [Pseudomonas syringae]MCF5382096.1 hypothetical protein [Pseudomonas syringae]MCF5422925.1 hypothetical protein [Pseudomonas syringae]MCF5455489.1 hypothetical protein [Pseudomonas syringae]MCF5460125.1 hypothetical protein [Pseudomonas syringae]
MKNSSKIKALAYSINTFVLGLTGGWIIPADFYKPISIISAILLLVMFLADLKSAFPKEKKKVKAKQVQTRKERPPRKRNRRKRK